MIAPQEQFRQAIGDSGLTPPDGIVDDGVLHRFSTNGKHGDDSGYYVLHADGLPAGIFGCWRSGFRQKWHANVGRDLTSDERARQRAHIEAAQRSRIAAEARRRSDASAVAQTQWSDATVAVQDLPSPYLDRKGVGAHGIRADGDALIIPVRDSSGALCSLQRINPAGDKRFLPGGRVKGCYHAIGTPNGTLCVAEGYATGASVYEATGHAVAIAFDAGNLKPVAEALRAKYPDITIVICADDDYKSGGNPGLTAATKAARAVGGLLAVPSFGAHRPGDATDFNDLARHAGADAVGLAVANAKPVDGQLDRPSSHDAPERQTTVTYRRVSDIKAVPIRWLWRNRIARGKVTILAGNPGLGKSQAVCSMAAIVTTGGRWPVDRTQADIGNVIILSAEDDPADTIRPRLEAAGTDLRRVFILDAVHDGFNADGEPLERAFNLGTDLSRLGAMMDEIGEVAMVVIDPITAYLGAVDSHRNAEVRALIAPLSELAGKRGAAVVCVSHLNKAGSSEALMRVTGSLAFVAAARAAFVVAKDPDDPTRRLFLPMKNNVGNDQTGLAFGVQGHNLAGGIETSRVVWEAEAVTVTADEAMAPQEDAEERSVLADAEEFLRDVLGTGPLPAKEVFRQAREAGHSERTVRRAQKSLGVEATKTGMTGGWAWQLDPKMAKKPEDGQTKRLDTFGKVGHLRAPSEPTVEDF